MLFIKNKLVTLLFLVLAGVYLAQTVLVKPDPATLAKYHITAHRAIGLGLTIAIPYVILWLIVLIGYVRLRMYQKRIAGSQDGHAYKSIATGVLWLSLFLPLSSILGNYATHYVHTHHGHGWPVRIVNYILVLVLLGAVLLLYRGSLRLLSFVKSKDLVSYTGPFQLYVVLYIIFCAIYVTLVLHDPSRRMPTKDVAIAGYYESDWAIVLTLIVPRLITWYLGLRAIMNLYLYRRKVNGVVYRGALKSLTFGLGWALGAIVVLRVTQTLSEQLAHFDVAALLIIIYVLLVIIAIGYVCIFRGASKLQKLEDV